MTIRTEKPGDESFIRKINVAAFEQAAEADLVDLLRKNHKEFISLVAVEDEKVLGHILFTPASIESEGKLISGMGLAPMAVLPEYQNKGIGSILVTTGLEQMKQLDIPFVIVLGHPEYYPKFGFETASNFGIKCEYEGVPDEAFMILIFDKEKMKSVKGVAKYRPEFAAAV